MIRLCVTGTKLRVKTVKTKGDIRNGVEPEYETREIYIVLHAVYMDYMMRCHVTHWFPPNSTYPGGWCRCRLGHVSRAAAEQVCAFAGPVADLWGFVWSVGCGL